MKTHFPIVVVTLAIAIFVSFIVWFEGPDEPRVGKSDVIKPSVNQEEQDTVVDTSGTMKPQLFLGDHPQKTGSVDEFAMFLDGFAQREWWERELRVSDSYERSILQNLLAFHGSVEGRRLVRHAWEQHKKAIVKLWRAGFLGSEVIFFHESPAYNRWLASVVLDASDSRLPALLLVEFQQGAAIRERFATQSDFRDSFKQLFGKLSVVSEKTDQPIEILLGHPDLWDLLRLPDGEALAIKYGAFAVICLVEKPMIDEALRPIIVRLLNTRNEEIYEFLSDPEHRAMPELADFLRSISHLSDERLASAILKLAQQEGALLPTLRNYKDLYHQGLLDDEFDDVFDRDSWDDSLPGYLKVMKRKVLGQRLDDGDEERATIDAVCHLLTVVDEVVIFTPLAPIKPVTSAVSGFADAVGDNTKRAIDQRVSERQDMIETLRSSINESDSGFLHSKSQELLLAYTQSQILHELQRFAETDGVINTRSAAASLTFFYSQSRHSVFAAATAKLIWDGGLDLHIGDFDAIVPIAPGTNLRDVSTQQYRLLWKQFLTNHGLPVQEN